MHFDLQPTLENDIIKLIPLKEEDFEMLYQVASDPLIWEQHPNKNRYERIVFEKFFKDAIKSRGAFLVVEKKSGEIIGSSRYYDLDETKKSIAIGYTFLARKFWGTTYNRAMKTLMLDHAFTFVDKVIFHIGERNIRSQKAIEKLGAIMVGNIERNLTNDDKEPRLVYEIKRNKWKEINNII